MATAVRLLISFFAAVALYTLLVALPVSFHAFSGSFCRPPWSPSSSTGWAGAIYLDFDRFPARYVECLPSAIAGFLPLTLLALLFRRVSGLILIAAPLFIVAAMVFQLNGLRLVSLDVSPEATCWQLSILLNFLSFGLSAAAYWLLGFHFAPRR